MDLTLPDRTGADLMDVLQERLEQDVAYEIHSPETIAERYGLTDEAGLRAYIAKHPKSLARIAALRAAHKSDGSVTERVQLKAKHALEQRMPGYINRVLHPSTPVKEQTDGMKVLQGLAGMAGAQAADKTAAAGATFSLNINFGDRVERISTTVVAPAEITAIAEDVSDAELPEEDA